MEHQIERNLASRKRFVIKFFYLVGIISTNFTNEDAHYFGDIKQFFDQAFREFPPAQNDVNMHSTEKRYDLYYLKSVDLPGEFSPIEMATFSLPKVQKKSDWVQFYSMRLLFVLRSMMENDVIAFNDLFASTVCSNSKWCNVAVMSKHLYRKSAYDFVLPFEQYDSMMCGKSNEDFQNKWVHKFTPQFLQKKLSCQ